MQNHDKKRRRQQQQVSIYALTRIRDRAGKSWLIRHGPDEAGMIRGDPVCVSLYTRHAQTYTYACVQLIPCAYTHECTYVFLQMLLLQKLVLCRQRGGI